MSADEVGSLEEFIPFLEVYPDYDLTTLPSWVADDIENAKVYGNKKRGVIMPDGQKYHLDNTLNDMNGRDWTLFINSVCSTHYPTRGKEGYAHEIRKIHPTPKPPQLMRDLIYFFTKHDEIVFDSFMGVGGTLIGASLANRRALGIDLNSDYIDAYKRASNELNLKEQATICGDCLEILEKKKDIEDFLQEDKISLMLIDPPYGNMMSKEKTGGDISVYGKNSTPFTESAKDLGNMEKGAFLDALKRSVELTLPYIKTRGYIVVFIKDLQPHKKDVNLLHADVINKLNEINNIYYKGMKIWSDESTKLYPYGYPFCFVANQIHQYILVFRKEK
ncbi:MAG: hypothetical protein IJ794_10725 [Lachnospiraceae bacterium]|nr:hypothetical protein [Lachnospiraceae bacterium]